MHDEQCSPLEPVFSGSRPTRQPKNTIVSLLAVSVQGEASALLVGGSKAVVTAHFLRIMVSVCNTLIQLGERLTRLTGVDNVLEVKIVTADGNHIIANAYCNKDLFWAIRGGGGGTWGVVTSVTYKTHPSTIFSAAFIAVNSTNANSTHKLFTEIIRLTPSLVEQGYGGYASGVSVQGFQFYVLSPNVTAEQTNATFFPLFEFAHSLPGLSIQNSTAVFQDWFQFFAPQYAAIPDAGFPLEVSSWLLPKGVVATDKPEVLARELLKTHGALYYW